MTGRARSTLAVLAIAVPLLAAGSALVPAPQTSRHGYARVRQHAGRDADQVQGAGLRDRDADAAASFPVTARYGGGFVESIDGLSGNSSRLDWFYYVNGVQAPQGAATTAVHRGDRIWWDLHDWSATDTIPAVVGSFPEPFIHGVAGRRYPTVLECGTTVAPACKHVTNELAADGVPVATQLLGAATGTDIITVVVGPWSAMHGTIVSQLLHIGPSASGVYARFTGPGGSSLQLLNPKGKVVRTLGAGAGLIAATDEASSGPTWVITGTDAAGVSAAAAALNAGALHDHFALAVQGGADFPVPLQGAS